jgi:hypothetical protein
MRPRAMLARTALVASSLLATALLLEVLVRTLPALAPRGAYGFSRFSADLEMDVHEAPALYNRGGWTRRVPNREGFLDVDHERAKPPGVRRIGFFGDSYVEALQVPLEETFVRRLPTEIAGRRTEALAFGISGWGTLHSLVTYRVMGPRYGLDDVVYLFVKNDPGDHHQKIKPSVLSAVLTADGTDFVIRKRAPQPDTPDQRITRWLYRELEVARVVRGAWRRALAKVAASVPTSRATASARVPDSNDPPSEWPSPLLEETQRLTRHILRGFDEKVRRDGRRFWVLYVPRGHEELDGRLTPENSWFPWLSQTCAELGIRLLDPRELLRAHRAAGATIDDDHWTPVGHALIASFVATELADALTAEPIATPPIGATLK